MKKTILSISALIAVLFLPSFFGQYSWMVRALIIFVIMILGNIICIYAGFNPHIKISKYPNKKIEIASKVAVIIFSVLLFIFVTTPLIIDSAKIIIGENPITIHAKIIKITRSGLLVLG